MTDVIVKATKVKRKAKFFILLNKNLTKIPNEKTAVISDLFPIKKGNEWLTEFELLNVSGLIMGDNNDSEPYVVDFYFYNTKGNLLGSRSITVENIGRKTVKLSELMIGKIKDAATFSVFHPPIYGKTDMAGSFLAERGYSGYEYQNLGVKGYVHGNLDAVALVKGEVLPLGNSGLIPRFYTVQHCLRGPSIYEFVFTNPTAKRIKITPNISFNENKWFAKDAFFMNPLGSHTFTVEVNENQKAYVRFKSKLYLGRPVVFRVANNSMDVFHG